MPQHGIGIRDFRVVETSDLPDDELENDGTVEVPDGEQESVLRLETPADLLQVHAYGMNDNQNCRFLHYMDNEIATLSESPLGQIGDPVQFTDIFGAPLQMDDEFNIVVQNSSGNPLKFAGRMFIQELNI